VLREGRWYAYLRVRHGEGAGPEAGDGHEERDIPLRALASLAAALPAHHTCEGREFTVDRRHGDRLFVQAGSVLAAAERGPYRRHRLRTAHYPLQREMPLRDAILYTAGRGDDSPRAVHEELVRRGTDVEHLWVTRDQRTHVPPLAHAIEEHSAAWYEALARCRRIVASDHLPDWFVRRPGQTVVQTWHGVPLRRIGTDLKGTPFAHHAHLEALPHLAAQWSVLVSPNRFATRHLCRALAYDGGLLQAGSPRNDLLFSPDRDKIAERVRSRLGIGEDRRVLLYAPTYRDHCGWLLDRTGGTGGTYDTDWPPGTGSAYGTGGTYRTGGTYGAYAPDAALGTHRPDEPVIPAPAGPFRAAWEPALDFRAAQDALAADHVLLVRRHPRTTGRIPGARAPFVRDVTHHPGTAELLLIADVLITDYSSLMFDFAHTGRPILFHTPDLEHFRDPSFRGFTFDFESRAPGPLLTSTQQVLSALCDLDTVTEQHADAYAAFREAYCDLDDGRAAARVADWLLR
jgi:CDP-glycerol glycerophosphotransferase